MDPGTKDPGACIANPLSLRHNASHNVYQLEIISVSEKVNGFVGHSHAE